MDKNINNFCDFFDTLSQGLKNSVVSICENSKNKSKIYSNINSLVTTIIQLTQEENIFYNEKHSNILKNTLIQYQNNKRMLDTILNLYKQQYPTENINEDLFILKLFNSCIKDYILYTSQPIFEEPEDSQNSSDSFDDEYYLGGKRRKSKKSKNNKSNKKKSKKNKNKSKKRYSRKYR